MSLGSRIRDLRKEKKMSQEELGKYLNVSKVSISGYENDTREPSKDAIVKLAQLFGVSTDYLLERSAKRHYYDLTEKDEKDVQKQLESTLNDLSNAGTLSFMKNGGTEISDEDAELLKASLENVIRQSKIIAKKKFTPKKYRDSADE